MKWVDKFEVCEGRVNFAFVRVQLQTRLLPGRWLGLSVFVNEPVTDSKVSCWGLKVLGFFVREIKVHYYNTYDTGKLLSFSYEPGEVVVFDDGQGLRWSKHSENEQRLKDFLGCEYRGEIYPDRSTVELIGGD